jgi:hypothetical protein
MNESEIPIVTYSLRIIQISFNAFWPHKHWPDVPAFDGQSFLLLPIHFHLSGRHSCFQPLSFRSPQPSGHCFQNTGHQQPTRYTL